MRVRWHLPRVKSNGPWTVYMYQAKWFLGWMIGIMDRID